MPRTVPAACLLLLCCCVAARAQDITHGTGSILKPNPASPGYVPGVADPNIDRLGVFDQWRGVAPAKNVAPSVVKVIGEAQDLHVALFNYFRAERQRESSIAFQLRPFRERQTVEVQVFAVEQDGRPVEPTPLAPPQKIELKRQGAVLPFTIEMRDGQSLTCEVLFLVGGREHGRAKIRADKKGLTFLSEVKPGKPAGPAGHN